MQITVNKIGVPLIISLVLIWIPGGRVGAWNAENSDHPPYSAHQFIVDAAIKHLRANGMLEGWPLEDFAPYIRYGVWYADYNPVNCQWGDFHTGVCDSIHHFYSTECIKLLDFGPTCIADPGDFAGPEYSSELYKIAEDFWPDSTKPRSVDVHSLVFKENAGSITVVIDGESLGPFVIGAEPFAALRRMIELDLDLLYQREWAYRWPAWTSGDRSIQASLVYLGWAIHFVEDFAFYEHSENVTGTSHKNFEDLADELIDNGDMDHLPVQVGDSYRNEYYPGLKYSTRPSFFRRDWSMLDYSRATKEIAIASVNPTLPDTATLISESAVIEAQLDTASKMVAGILDKYFSSKELPPDRFEPNNLPTIPTILDSGTYENLTIHAPLDEDFYKITVREDFGRLRILSLFDGTPLDGEIGALINHRDCETCPIVQDGVTRFNSGWRFEASYIPSGRIYYIEISALNPRPFSYSLQVASGQGDLPLDRYEPNNTASEAAKLNHTCDFTSTLNLHNDSDNDFFLKSAVGRSLEAKVLFNPSETSITLNLTDSLTTTTLDHSTTEREVRVVGCGSDNSRIRVSGERGDYEICISELPIQNGCPGYSDWIPFVGTGTFKFTYSPPLSGQGPTEFEFPIRNRLYATSDFRIETALTYPEEIEWLFVAWIDYGRDISQLVQGTMTIHTGPPKSVEFSTHVPQDPGGLPSWIQIPPVGQGDATFQGLPYRITSIDLSSSGLQWSTSKPNETASLIVSALIDSDGDLLPDSLENLTGTRSHSSDSDGDGLLDSSEDMNVDGTIGADETDPRVVDSDGDGLMDGLEKGLLTPEGGNMATSIFNPDADPSTTTDAIKADTDGDGLLDGQEDANRNGAVDPSETAPFVNDGVATPPGANTQVSPAQGVLITYTEVTNAGTTTVLANPDNPHPNGSNFQFLSAYYLVVTTAEYSEPVTICFIYPEGADTENLTVLHFESGEWTSLASTIDTTAGSVCAEVATFSWFAMGKPKISASAVTSVTFLLLVMVLAFL